jgi:hypoxanthine phosphoribosyltransferase
MPALVSVNQYEVPNWNQVYDMLLSLMEQIEESGFRPEVVVGIIRGGVVPARVLVDLLEVPLLGAVQVEFYVGLGETSAAPVLRQGLALSVTGRRFFWLMTLRIQGGVWNC